MRNGSRSRRLRHGTPDRLQRLERPQTGEGSLGLRHGAAGVLVSDSLMFQRATQSQRSHLSHVYGLALPLLKRGLPVTPVQLENATLPGCLEAFGVILMSYTGQKPLAPEVHKPLADWVRRVACWSCGTTIRTPTTGSGVVELDGRHYVTRASICSNNSGWRAPAGAGASFGDTPHPVGKAPCFAAREPGQRGGQRRRRNTVDRAMTTAVATAGLSWRETNYLRLERGPYVIAAGLDESVGDAPKTLRGRFVNLFDPELNVRSEVVLAPAAGGSCSTWTRRCPCACSAGLRMQGAAIRVGERRKPVAGRRRGRYPAVVLITAAQAPSA